MAEPRRAVSDRDLLVMFICLWRDEDGTPAVDWNWARTATDREIIDRFRSTYQIDHHPFARWMGGRELDRGWNYRCLREAPHQEKSSKIDIPEAAKSKRIQKKHEEFRRKLLAKSSIIGQIEEGESNRAAQKRTKPKKAWPKRKVMGWRKMDGTPVWADRRDKKQDRT